MDRKEKMSALVARIDKMMDAVREAEGHEVSDSVFAQRYLTFSASTLCRMRSSDNPYEGNLDNIEEKIAQAEGELDERLSVARSSRDAERGFVQTTLAKAVQTSVKKARNSRLRKIVVVLAPTGAGKSEIGKMLAARGAVYIEGRQSWRKSYKAFCGDISKSAGRPIKSKRYTEHDAEERMLQALTSRDNILYLDEANTLSPESVNAIKLMVNVTGSVVIVAMVPKAWDTLTEVADEEIDQFINRCQPIIRHKALTDDDVRPFLERSGICATEVSKVVGQVASAANEFGSIKSVVALSDLMRERGCQTADDVIAEIRFSAKNFSRTADKKGVSK